MKIGYIKLHRELADHEMWDNGKFDYGKAWVDLLMMANHAPKSFWIRNQEILVDRGQVAYGKLSLSKRWRWSQEKVSHFVAILLRKGMATSKSDNRTTLISICNYSKYQDVHESKPVNKPRTNREQTETNNNDKNDKNDKNTTTTTTKTGRKPFLKPTPDMVSVYAKEINFDLDGHKFCDHYESKGWVVGKTPMKDWKACVRTWKNNGYGGKNNGQQRSYGENSTRIVKQGQRYTTDLVIDNTGTVCDESSRTDK